jgi:hypothetical protein
MDKNQKVSLGCGTLILIALIVIIFGNADSDKLRHDIQTLSNDVKSLQSSIQSQSRQIYELKEVIEDLTASQAGAAPR